MHLVKEMENEIIMVIIALIIAAVILLFPDWKQVFNPVLNGLNLASDPGVAKHRQSIEMASKKYSVPAAIIAGVAWQESRGNEMALGAAGEIGVMQIMEPAAIDLWKNKIWHRPIVERDAHNNIMQGAAYLSLQYRRAGNWPDAIRSYNAGFRGAMDNPARSRGYLESVLKKVVEYDDSRREQYT